MSTEEIGALITLMNAPTTGYGQGTFSNGSIKAALPATPFSTVTAVAVLCATSPVKMFPVPVLSIRKGFPSKPPIAWISPLLL